MADYAEKWKGAVGPWSENMQPHLVLWQARQAGQLDSQRPVPTWLGATTCEDERGSKAR